MSAAMCRIAFFFFQAEDGIRDKLVTGVQTCALPIFLGRLRVLEVAREESPSGVRAGAAHDELALRPARDLAVTLVHHPRLELPPGPAEGARRRLSRIVAVAEDPPGLGQIGRASCRERV